jgi:hypothetical protein
MNELLCPCGPRCKRAKATGSIPTCELFYQGKQPPREVLTAKDCGSLWAEVIARTLEMKTDATGSTVYSGHVCPGCGCQVFYREYRSEKRFRKDRIHTVASC